MGEEERQVSVWEELADEKIVAADQFEPLWQSWAQGEGFTVSCSLGDWYHWEEPNGWCDALTVSFEQDHAQCRLNRDAIASTIHELRKRERQRENRGGKAQQKKQNRKSLDLDTDYLRSALLRSGWVTHSNIGHVERRLTQYDDIIVCADTNILIDSVFSSILLPMLAKNDEPNWILIAIPKVAMAEIETWASRRFSSGYPTARARLAQRALQEILALDTKKDPIYRGLSIMSVGELPPDFSVLSGDSVRKDSAIRRQFRDFLRGITFHKGSFLISQDRVNVMMARAEGLEGLYLQKPEWEEIGPRTVREDEEKGVLLWRLIYELCVGFGRIRIERTSATLELDISWPGKHVVDWEAAKVMVEAKKAENDVRDD